MGAKADFQFPLAHRALAIKPSLTLAIAAKAKQMRLEGKKVLSLSAGEPDFDTPECIKEEAIEALRRGETKYTPAQGTLALREAICEKLKRENNLTFSPDQVVVTVGAKHALFNVMLAMLNEADEVIIPAPYWLSYPEMVTLAGARPVFVKTHMENGYKLQAQDLEKVLSGKTKLLILNSPSNPTGTVYEQKDLEALIEVLRHYPHVAIVSDEIYEKFVFDGKAHLSIAQLDASIAKRTLIVNGHSKAYAMTGWRLGYVAVPDIRFAKAIASIQSHSTSNVTSFVQAAGVVAFQKAEEEVKKMRAVFEQRRDRVWEKIKALKPLEAFRPEGAFYLFVRIEKTGMDSLQFASQLLEEAQVAVVPGEPFGDPHAIRLSFATSEEVLDEALDRISTWLSQKGLL